LNIVGAKDKGGPAVRQISKSAAEHIIRLESNMHSSAGACLLHGNQKIQANYGNIGSVSKAA
jgi:hypothetical protein